MVLSIGPFIRKYHGEVLLSPFIRDSAILMYSQSFSLFLPSIIAGMGYQSTTAQLFTVPPNIAAFLTVIGTAYASDKLKNRGYFIIGGCVLGICGYIMLIVAKTNAVRYAGTFLVAIGVFQGSPMLMVSLFPVPPTVL